MYSPNDDPGQSRLLYNAPEENYVDYDAGQETGAVKQNIFIDKSKHITNYTVNINVTGSSIAKFDTITELAMSTYIVESELSNKLLALLDEIEDLSEEPAAFEQKLSLFLSMLDELDERRIKREIYFSDLLSMIRMGLINIECNELSKKGIEALREAVSSFTHKVTEQKIQDLRSILNKNGIDLLKTFKLEIDTKSVLKEIYGDEITA